MTPHEKAVELFDKFSLWYYHVENSKYCALIAVDEIMNALQPTSGGWDFDYWEEVKQEIEKL